MPFNQLVSQIETILEPLYKGRFYIDTTRLADYLVTHLGQNINNITLPVQTIVKIITNPISIGAYAKIYNISYSSMIKNKTLYVSLLETKVNQRSHFTVAEFEAAHFQRLNNRRFGREFEHRIKLNKELAKALNKDAISQGKSVEDILVRIVENYYNIP
jgi:hypothetical protein